MEYTKNIDGDSCRIKLKGKFTFADHKEFKKVFSSISEKTFKQLTLDISEVEYIDSAALGLLLLTKEEAEKNSVSLTIYKPHQQVQKMFKISRFYELFNVVD